MKGIDLSENNGYIDFNKVKNAGIDFVIIRVGWIGNKENHTVDEYFEDYYKRAKTLGLKIGFYVYSYCKSISAIKSGTRWVLDKIQDKTNDLGIFIDMEDSTISYLGKDELTAHCVQFCDIISSRGLIAGVYANLNWFKNYLHVDKLLPYKIWLAQYTNASNHSANFRVDIWQYSSKGSINGINGHVDLNKVENLDYLPEFTEDNHKNEGGEYIVKTYQNGSTKETVFSDKNLQNQIGYLNPYEKAECYGIVDNKAIIVYNIDGTNNKKVGFVKWLGGIVNG